MSWHWLYRKRPDPPKGLPPSVARQYPRRMKNLTHGLAIVGMLSLIVAVPSAQAPATPAAPQTVIQKVRAAIAEDDFKKGEAIVLNDLAEKGTTPEAIEALSWLGRGAVAAKRYDEAQGYAAQTYTMVEEALMTRKLDDETHLPLALGASIEVQALALAGQGGRSDAVLFLRRELETYKGTSIVERLNKNVNLLSLEGTPALALDRGEEVGSPTPSLGDLRGKPVMLYLWAHWCGDCKVQGPILETLMNKYKNTGLTLIAPTKLYGYVARRKTAEPEEELAYIGETLDKFYPWMKAMAIPVSAQVFERYGVSTTPTLVLIDRAGNVSKYNPGRLTAEELEPLIQAIAAPVSSAK